MMTNLRTGRPLGPQLLIEEAEVAVAELDPGMLNAMRSRWVIGDPSGAADEVARLAATSAVDEVMIQPVAGAYAGTARSEEHTSELQSLMRISYADFGLK